MLSIPIHSCTPSQYPQTVKTNHCVLHFHANHKWYFYLYCKSFTVTGETVALNGKR